MANCLTCFNTSYFNSGNGTTPPNVNCTQCDSSCFMCSGDSPQNCTKCRRFDNYSEYLNPNNTCQTTCPDGFFEPRKNEGGTCLQCQSPCEWCFGPNFFECESCEVNYFLEQNTCKDYCSNYSTYPNITTRKCENCHSNCLTCDGHTENNCTACDVPTRLKLGKTCYRECPGGYYDNRGAGLCMHSMPSIVRIMYWPFKY
jgi:proprotein convertase subtilisin/kexin type 5